LQVVWEKSRDHVNSHKISLISRIWLATTHSSMTTAVAAAARNETSILNCLFYFYARGKKGKSLCVCMYKKLSISKSRRESLFMNKCWHRKKGEARRSITFSSFNFFSSLFPFSPSHFDVCRRKNLISKQFFTIFQFYLGIFVLFLSICSLFLSFSLILNYLNKKSDVNLNLHD
jgi:hypothetical protein